MSRTPPVSDDLGRLIKALELHQEADALRVEEFPVLIQHLRLIQASALLQEGQMLRLQQLCRAAAINENMLLLVTAIDTPNSNVCAHPALKNLI